MKNSTYKEKFAILKSWNPQIFDSIKKDLKNDHLRNDIPFTKQFFAGKNTAKLTTEDLAEGYQRALDESEHAETIGEFISNRWLMKNSDLYNFFAEKLMHINPNFNEIEELSENDSNSIIKEGKEQFNAQDLFIFALLNSVAFSENTFKDLHKQAKTASETQKVVEEAKEVEKSFEKLINNHEMLFARMVDKYEKKLSGLEKKYHQDVEGLKKQVSHLQKQLKS
ncbi:MAG: hypothetical protein H0U49_07010 [Parachlamydiaceae bacterium]|nr:hypothetical protein [Parachlamydiaceae bacterium]